MEKLNGESMNIVNENVTKLKELFPEVFSEDKIDFQKLEEELGQFATTDPERYNFTWMGKSQAKVNAQTPSTGTLRPSKEDSKDWNTTQNLYIEGDNLEVLKLLQKSYHKRVKMIYIDPPYNTGKEFIYPDNYHDNLDTYLEYTNQKGEDGKKFSVNAETSGRYHTNWLNMMYPRLKLARNLLKDDGVIFISIDDNEVSNLQKLCDEVFGEGNFINKFIWQKNSSGKTVSNQFPVNSEYVLMYCKSINSLQFNVVYKPLSQATINSYNKNDNDGRGNYCTVSLQKTSTPGPLTTYDYIDNTGKVWKCPGKGWRMIQEKVKNLENDGRLYFSGETLREKVYWEERENKGKVADTLWNDLDEGNIGTSELKKLFGEFIFDFPKPVNFLNRPISIGSDKDSIILDFFSGSSTTAHATMQKNSEDGGTRKFIMVQLPEETDSKSEAYKAGYNTICEIGKERIRKAGNKIKSSNNIEDLSNLDIGFKVFKLDSSNIKEWDSDFENLEESLLDSVENIKSDRTQEDLLYEILLKYGLDLTLPIEEKTIDGKKVFVIGFGALVVCLDDGITTDIVEDIAKLKEEYQSEIMRVVFKDSSFSNAVVKTNAIQILKQHDIDEVVSI